MRSISSLLSEYGESHQNETNKMIHWICVPIIFWTVTALLWAVKLFDINGFQINLGIVVLALVWLYYIKLSINLSFGMLFFGLICLGLNYWLESIMGTSNLVYTALIIFFLSWVGQFYGHKVEGKKPSFLKDLQFLFVGPAWLMHFVYIKLGINY